MDASTSQLANRLAKEVPAYMAADFVRDLLHDAATALMESVAMTFLATHHKVNKRFFLTA